MPLKSIDYSKTIIYKICCKDVNIKDIYIGSTTDFLRRRSKHKSDAININSKSYNLYIYEFIRNNGGFENFEMVEIERYNAVDSNDALKRERYWLETLGATLNKVIPTRTQKEYYIDNQEYFKEYYVDNKEKIQEYTKEYREVNKEKAKEYYEANKEKLLEKRKEKITCDCGSVFCKGDILKHNKTKKHINFFESNNPDNYDE